MPLLSKLKREFEGLRLNDRTQGLQQEASATPSSQTTVYDNQTALHSNNPYQQQNQSHPAYPSDYLQPYQGASHSQSHGSAQHTFSYQPYDGQRAHLVQQPYGLQAYSANPHFSGAVKIPDIQQQPLSSGHLPSDPSMQQDSASPAPPAPYTDSGAQGFVSQPTQWATHSLDHSYYNTNPGVLNGDYAYEDQVHHPGQSTYPRPGNGDTQRLQRESIRPSPHTMLAAAGGFAAGGAAGYFVKDRIDARKAKKRHGRNAADFSDFAEYPNMEVDLECNICDQVISGPYAHCKKCDAGDYDVCRDCLAQGETCDGKGKHNLVKVYPKYYCDICDQCIIGQFYHCARCNDSDWDICQACLNKGYSCLGRDRGETHDLTKLYIPNVKHEKKGRYKRTSSSSSRSSSDSD